MPEIPSEFWQAFGRQENRLKRGAFGSKMAPQGSHLERNKERVSEFLSETCFISQAHCSNPLEDKQSSFTKKNNASCETLNLSVETDNDCFSILLLHIFSRTLISYTHILCLYGA